MDGRLTKTQVTSRPGTIGPEVWSSMSKCAHKKAKQRWDIEKPKLQAARQNWETSTIILPTKLKNLNASKKLNIPVEPAVPCVPRIRISTDAESCSAKSSRLSVVKRDRQIKAFESQRRILHKGRNHSHEDHVAGRGFRSRPHGLVKIWYTHLCR